MKKYIEIQIDILDMGDKDILTYSIGWDNDFYDENWFDEN